MDYYPQHSYRTFNTGSCYLRFMEGKHHYFAYVSSALHIFSANVLRLNDVECWLCLFSSRLDSSRENQLKTWRTIWRTPIEAWGSVASIPQVNSYFTSSQGHRDHIAGPSLGTFGNMKIRVWVYQSEPSALLDTLIHLHVFTAKFDWMWTQVNLWDSTRLVDILPNHESQALYSEASKVHL